MNGSADKRECVNPTSDSIEVTHIQRITVLKLCDVDCVICPYMHTATVTDDNGEVNRYK